MIWNLFAFQYNSLYGFANRFITATFKMSAYHYDGIAEIKIEIKVSRKADFAEIFKPFFLCLSAQYLINLIESLQKFILNFTIFGVIFIWPTKRSPFFVYQVLSAISFE